MQVIRYYHSERQAHWLEEIGRSDWNAGAFLYRLLRDGTFFEAVGEGSDVLLLTEGDELISFCTFAEKDDIQPTELTPWIGFVYTFPAHRGHRCAGRLFEEAARLARQDGITHLYLSTNHIGLYEKYGFVYLTQLTDMDGELSRIYVKNTREMLMTERLIFRPWEECDAENLFVYARDPDVGPPAGWEPHQSVEKSRYVISNLLNGDEAYAVCLKEDNKPIGAIELMLQNRRADKCDECELGFWIAKPFWGQGLIPEAARELLRRAFEDLGMAKVWCAYYDGNGKSKRAQEKLGFIYHHTNEAVEVPSLHKTRTEHVNCLTKEQWIHNNSGE